jgi:putative peptide maturation system protein
MSTTIQQPLAEMTDFLLALSREAIRPREAQARLRLIQQRYPDITLDLLWEEQTYDRSPHYDLLLRLSELGSFSLSFAPLRTLPWPLRGVQRWRDVDLVRVNNVVLDVAQAVSYLDTIWGETRIIDRMVNTCLIQEALEKDPIELSDAELQRAMDGFRRARRLYTVEETQRWMERHGMSHTQFEGYVADEALVAKLRDRVTADQVEPFFAARHADFDTARIAQITFADETTARRLYDRIRDGELDFYAAAQDHFTTAGAHTASSPDLFAAVQRGQAPEWMAPVFAAAADQLLGPLDTGEGYALVRVLSVSTARLDEPTRHAIKKILFENWLAERRQAARIEWNWGQASQTSQTA